MEEINRRTFLKRTTTAAAAGAAALGLSTVEKVKADGPGDLLAEEMEAREVIKQKFFAATRLFNDLLQRCPEGGVTSSGEEEMRHDNELIAKARDIYDQLKHHKEVNKDNKNPEGLTLDNLPEEFFDDFNAYIDKMLDMLKALDQVKNTSRTEFKSLLIDASGLYNQDYDPRCLFVS